MGFLPPSYDESLLSDCAECSTDGSCTCQSYATGEADLLTSDQTYWGGAVEICPTVPVAIRALYALALLATSLAGVWCTYALLLQTRFASQKRRNWTEHRPNWVCTLFVLSACCNIGLCVTKLVDPRAAIGINILASALFAASRSLFYFGSIVQIVDFFAVAVSVQESTYGQQRIREALAKEHLLFILPAFHTCIECIPLFNAILAVDGDSNMERVQPASLVCFLVGNACCVAFGCTWHLSRAKKMLLSFEQSKASLQDFCVATVGGQAMADKFFDTKFIVKNALEAPASMQAVINELHSLKQAHKKVSKHSKKIMIPGAVTVFLFLLFACVPLLWDKMSYLIALSSILIPQAMYEAASNYIRSQTRPLSVPPLS